MTLMSERALGVGVSASSAAVEVVDVVKTYPRPGAAPFNAVDGMTFRVERGEVFGILGPNGAGKTTTLEILEGIKKPTTGTATVLGLRVGHQQDRIRERIGVQLQAASYFDHLRLGEILTLFGSFYDTAMAPEDLLDLVGLADRRNALVRELSGGQAQRFSIVAALVNNPDLVFLDEPTTGLDPQARRNLWDVIDEMNRVQDKTIVLTTHYMEEAEVLSHRVGIVDAGHMVALDTPNGLIATHASGHRLEFSVASSIARDEFEALPGVTSITSIGNGVIRYRLTTDDPNSSVPALYRWSEKSGVPLSEVSVHTATLEDVFLAVTGRSLRD